jgi:hypothetical protein
MKKSLFLISLLALVLFSACKKDKDEPNPFDVTYTDETTEESKANVEQNAIDFVDKMDQMSSATAVEVLMNLNNLQSGQQYVFSPVTDPLIAMSSVNKNEGTAKIFDSMKSLGEMFEDDPVNFSDMFDSIAGKYTYDFESGEFIESELADMVVIEFPGKETDITNTATITIDNFSVSEITNPLEEWPEGLDPELPASIDINLAYNDVSIAGIAFDADYQSDGLPTSVTVELYLDDFTFTTTATHNPYSSASWKNTLKFQEEILFETYIAANGNWSEDNIDNNITEEEYTDEWGTWTETSVHFEEIIKNANAHVILMNLQVVGKVNIKALGDAMWVLDEEEFSTEAYAQAQVDAINENAELVVIYRDSNKMIAKAEAYVESYYDSYYDETEYYPSMRFVYSDGSKVDVETYVNSELDGFYDSINDFIDKLNTEYDLDIDHVNPDDV